MKNITTTLLMTIGLLLSFSASAQTWSHKRSVEAYTVTNASEPSITLKWEVENNTDSFLIYRRDLGTNDWGNPIASLQAADTMFKDSDVEKNHIYEYSINRINTDNEPLSSSGEQLYAYSFISAAIELEPVHFRGKMLVLVSSTLIDNLANELKQLKLDLVGDGWDVQVLEVTESDSVGSVKQMIMDKYNSEDGLDAVYLLGNIPIPYSGTYCDDIDWPVPPDGHGATDQNSHCGAWAADIYYISADGAWTDEKISDKGKRDANKNYVADGKFDNIMLPSEALMPLGKVDLSNLPAFPDSELDLIKRYLQKSHEYKYVMYSPLRMGIIEDNFSGVSEGFASQAWGDFSAQFGPENIVQADLFTSTASDDFLFNYVCGAGGYYSCAGLGHTDSFISNNPAVFNHMFGSFFGDFDINNNIGRSSLASPKNGLVWMWSGRPKWLTHTLAIGETIGECAVRTQNNNWDYSLSFFQNQVHVGLLGDPGVRSSMFEPVTALSSGTNAEKTNVTLNWTGSVATGITGYYVYWSNNEFGPYFLLNQTPEAGTSFTHYTPEFGSNYYMVRAERLEQTASGTYFNLSQGQFERIDGIQRTASVKLQYIGTEFTVYPIPARSAITLRFTDNSNRLIRILNPEGKTLLESTSTELSLSMDISSLSAGIYFVLVNGSSKRIIVQ